MPRVGTSSNRLDHVCNLDIDIDLHSAMGRMTGIIGTIGMSLFVVWNDQMRLPFCLLQGLIFSLLNFENTVYLNWYKYISWITYSPHITPLSIGGEGHMAICSKLVIPFITSWIFIGWWRVHFSCIFIYILFMFPTVLLKS